MLALMSVALAVASSVAAQEAPEDDQSQVEEPPPQDQTPFTRAGQTAESAAGQVGERKLRTDTIGVAPMARIDNRIQNRLQSRHRNRIDQAYDPAADAASPFEAAEERLERTGRP